MDLSGGALEADCAGMVPPVVDRKSVFILREIDLVEIIEDLLLDLVSLGGCHLARIVWFVCDLDEWVIG